MGCWKSKDLDSNNSIQSLNASLLNPDENKDEILGIKRKKEKAKSTKKLVSLDLLQTAAISGRMKYKIINEMIDFKTGYCALIDGTLQIYKEDINGVVYTKGFYT